MFREFGKNARVRNVPKNARKAALNKGGGSKANKQKQMEKDMLEMMMGMDVGPSKKVSKNKKNRGRK